MNKKYRIIGFIVVVFILIAAVTFITRPFEETTLYEEHYAETLQNTEIGDAGYVITENNFILNPGKYPITDDSLTGEYLIRDIPGTVTVRSPGNEEVYDETNEGEVLTIDENVTEIEVRGSSSAMLEVVN